VDEPDRRANEAVRDVVARPALFVGRVIVLGAAGVALVGAVVAAALLWPDHAAAPAPTAPPATGRSPSDRRPRRRGR